MKRLSLTLAMAAIVLAPFATSGTAFAETSCQIGFTGPGSTNMCTSVETYTCEVNNTNNVTVLDANEQDALSGTSLVVSNTSGGSSSTGSATNSNSVTFNVTVTNGNGDGDGGGVCTVVATTQPIPAGGSGSIVIDQPTVLPNTSGDLMSVYLPTLVGVFGASALISYLAVAISRR